MVVKLMFALWSDDVTGLHADLRDGALRARLATVGVNRMQLNLDDAAVAAALRLATAAPIAAVVSTWADEQDQRAVVDALGELGARIAGWSVDERRRLDPPEAADGERAEALANVAVLRRPDELSHGEWLRRWMVEHTPVAIRTQATFGYVQNVVTGTVTPDAPPVAGIVEELFPSAAITDPHAFYGSGGDDAELGRRLETLMASVARIGADRDLDLVPTSRYVYRLRD